MGKELMMEVGLLSNIFVTRTIKCAWCAFKNVANVVSFLCKSLFERPKTSYIGHCKPIKRIFWFIGIDDVDHNTTHTCDPIYGTQKLHSICAFNQYDVTKLMIIKLACFCYFYMERQC
jgi:hypothetical protein